jgi:hypothetical protein
LVLYCKTKFLRLGNLQRKNRDIFLFLGGWEVQGLGAASDGDLYVGGALYRVLRWHRA